jgi:hypothetical protein
MAVRDIYFKLSTSLFLLFSLQKHIVIDFWWRFISHDIMRHALTPRLLRFLINSREENEARSVESDSREPRQGEWGRIMTNLPNDTTVFWSTESEVCSWLLFHQVFLRLICFDLNDDEKLGRWWVSQGCCLKRHHRRSSFEYGEISLLPIVGDANSSHPLAQGKAFVFSFHLALCAFDVISF